MRYKRKTKHDNALCSTNVKKHDNTLCSTNVKNMTMQYKPPLPKGIPIPIPAMRPPRGSISPLANAFFTSTFLEFKLILFLTEIKTSTLLVLQLAFYTSEQKYRHGWVRAAGRARKSLSWKESPRQPSLHKPTFMTMNICMCHSHQFSFQWKHTFFLLQDWSCLHASD